MKKSHLSQEVAERELPVVVPDADLQCSVPKLGLSEVGVDEALFPLGIVRPRDRLRTTLALLAVEHTPPHYTHTGKHNRKAFKHY